MKRSRVGVAAAALLLFVTLSVVHTWPLAQDLGRNSRVDNGDMMLNAWIVSWVAHQLPRDPLRLFEANIFWPEHRTLAFSEPLIVPAIAALPATWLGGSAVLVHNLALLIGFATTAWAFCLLTRAWTGTWSAGLVAGSLAGFNAHTLTRLAHLQAHYFAFLALAWYALDRLFTRQRARDSVTLGVALALELLSSIYLFVFAVWSVALGAVARTEWSTRSVRARCASLLALSILVWAAVAGPVLAQYVLVSREQGFSRNAAETRLYASRWTDYLYTGAHVHSWWSPRRFGDSQAANFPGVVATALAVVAVARRRAWHDSRVRMLLVTLAGAVLLSVSPGLPGGSMVHDAVPAMGAIRNYARFGELALVALSVLAGFGVARIGNGLSSARSRTIVAVALLVLVNAEALRAPVGYRRFTGIPPVYRVLRTEPGAVVAELPMFPTRDIARNAGYVLNSTSHWAPIVNGYSSFTPPNYEQRASVVVDFPSDTSVSALRALGITHVVVHRTAFLRMYGPERLLAVSRKPALRLLAESDDVRVFRLGP